MSTRRVLPAAYPHTRAGRRRPDSTSRRRMARSSSIRRMAYPCWTEQRRDCAILVLAMLQALAEEHSDREIWWLHGARNRCCALVRRRSPRSPRLAAPERAHAHVVAKPTRNWMISRALRLRYRWLSQPSRCSPNSAGLGDAEAYLWDHTVAWRRRHQRRPGRAGNRCRTHPYRAVRTCISSDIRHCGDTRVDAPPTHRPTRRRSNDRVRPQQPRYPMELSITDARLEFAEAMRRNWSAGPNVRRTGVCQDLRK